MMQTRKSLVFVVAAGWLCLTGAEGCFGGDDDGAKSFTPPRSTLGIVDPNGVVPTGYKKTSLKITLMFDDQQTLDDTKRVMLVLREKPAMGDGCDALWSTTASTLKEAATVFDANTTSGSFVVPATAGMYTFLAYGYKDPVNLLCADDAWCESEMGTTCMTAPSGIGLCATKAPTPVAGGCVIADLKLDGTVETFSVMLPKRM